MEGTGVSSIVLKLLVGSGKMKLDVNLLKLAAGVLSSPPSLSLSTSSSSSSSWRSSSRSGWLSSELREKPSVSVDTSEGEMLLMVLEPMAEAVEERCSSSSNCSSFEISSHEPDSSDPDSSES